MSRKGNCKVKTTHVGFLVARSTRNTCTWFDRCIFPMKHIGTRVCDKWAETESAQFSTFKVTFKFVTFLKMKRSPSYEFGSVLHASNTALVNYFSTISIELYIWESWGEESQSRRISGHSLWNLIRNVQVWGSALRPLFVLILKQ